MPGPSRPGQGVPSFGGGPPGMPSQQPGQGMPNFAGGPPGMPPQQFGQPPAMRPTGPPQFGGPPQMPPMTPNSGPPGFGEGSLPCKLPPHLCMHLHTRWHSDMAWGSHPELKAFVACMSASLGAQPAKAQ